jgi:four helix bundle protein
MKPHQKLDAWKKSFFFVKSIYMITGKFPPDERFGLTSQMRRSAVSIPSNIAEGAGRKSKKEFIQFLSISLGSLSELDTQILLSKELDFIDKATCDGLIIELDNIGKLIYGLMKSLGYKSEV